MFGSRQPLSGLRNPGKISCVSESRREHKEPQAFKPDDPKSSNSTIFICASNIYSSFRVTKKKPKRQPDPQNPIESAVCFYRHFVFDVCFHSVQVNLKEQGQLIRQDEFLVTLRKKKCFRHIFLFQELVLFSKTRKTEVGNDTYIYKQSFKVLTYAKCPQIQG